MNHLIDIIESRGASLDQRTSDRLFGDVLGKSRDLKNTMLKSMRSLLSPESIERNVKIGHFSSVYSKFNVMGNTTNALIQLRETNNPQILIDFIKYVLKTIESVKDDILNYRDDMADERGY